ncbi:ROK family protein [Acidocella sp.]|uniref:ROK family protein n=1 Tax=Acidocella sp. TaxID=50710 RepID=UPI0026105EEB|nr:ROK family protein [Acidocella sp.]
MAAVTPPQRVLVIDIGGTGIKAALLDADGNPLADRRRCPTPPQATPPELLKSVETLIQPFGDFDALSFGFPGAIKNGVILTAPNLGTQNWAGTRLAQLAEQRFHRPARLVNDATLHGLGLIAGQGIEVALTLGTGMGFALFSDGIPAPQIELGRHPASRAPTYDDFVGDAALKRAGEAAWKDHVQETLSRIAALVNFDRLYLGGGNARLFSPAELPENVRLANNETGLTGGARLWRV